MCILIPVTCFFNALINGLVVLFSNCLLLAYRNTVDFFILPSNAVILLNSLSNSKSFFEDFKLYFIYKKRKNRESFTFFFLVCLDSFSCFITLSRTSSEHQIKVLRVDILVLFFIGETSLSPLIIMVSTGIFCRWPLSVSFCF